VITLLRVLYVPALTALIVSAQPQATADVVVAVDTSTSMGQPGMDPERTSLLVAKLLADIVPGNLAVVRLLDLEKDKKWIPSKEIPGEKVKCAEDPSKECSKVEAEGDWDSVIRANKYGALIRPSRGDDGFKQQLDGHISQTINNSFFGLAFRAAQGVFDPHAAGPPRTVIWLSDGACDDVTRLRDVVRELREKAVSVEVVVFGRGKTELASSLGLSPRQARSPAELMKAFAGSFRKIVQAPYEIDNLVKSAPSFEMKERVGEAWIVVYGDDTLGDVTIDTPRGSQPANYARERDPRAGAYRVLYTQNPPAGRWTVHATGGGGGAAYAVVQRSALGPLYLDPRSAVAGVPVTVIAGVGPERTGQVLSRSDLPEGLEMDLTIAGRTYVLNDEGKSGDQTAGDGRYSAVVTFEKAEPTPVALRVRGSILDKTIQETIEVTGIFRYKGGPLTLDLGSVQSGNERCREIGLSPAEHTGAVPFELRVRQGLYAGHTLEVRGPRGNLRAGGPSVMIGPNERLQVCLVTTKMAATSSGKGEPWLEVAPVESTDVEGRVPIGLRWELKGLSPVAWFFARWGVWAGVFAGAAALLIVGYGFVGPRRFQHNLALVFVADYSDLGDSPVPIAQANVGRRWYRHARAYLHSDFKVNREPADALAALHPVAGGTEVRPGTWGRLEREIDGGDWEPVSTTGRRVRNGEVYRAAENGPYFRISVKP